jgi:HK97 family phage portal protein
VSILSTILPRRKSLDFIDAPAPSVDGFNTSPFVLIDELRRDGGLPLSHRTMYERHAGVRAVVDTLSRNVAQVPFGAVTTTRKGIEPSSGRLNDVLAQIDRAMLVIDLLTEGESMHLIVQDTIPVRLDPTTTTVNGTGSNITEYTIGGRTFDPSDVLHIKLPNPRDPRRGLSPLASLRGLVELDLAEQDARLRRAGMPPVMVKRPMDAPKWGDAARMRFEERVTALLKGARRGTVPTLEEGMELAPVPGPSEADYVASRQFVLTTICAVLGVPAQSASVTDRNLDAAHRALYTDAIGPLTQLIADQMNAFLPERVLGATQTAGGRITARFDISTQQWGSIKEQTNALAESVGGPWQTVNEARAELGLPPLPDGDRLYPPRAAPPAGGAA